MQILLHGDKDFTDDLNRGMLLFITLCFIHKIGRLDYE